MVGIYQILEKSVAKNILKTGVPPKTGLSSWEGETKQQKTDSTVTKKCSVAKWNCYSQQLLQGN